MIDPSGPAGEGGAAAAPSVCPRCGASFSCGAATGQCWCMDEAFHLPLPAAGDDVQGCYCPSCLKAVAAERLAARDAGPS